MAKKKAVKAVVLRKPRADAQRNRELILVVAKKVFKRDGAAATMDEIARLAEIGPGTLYRHFPSREALIEAVNRSEVEKLVAAGEMLRVTRKPLEALRAWMLVFIDHVADKRLILAAMESVPGGSEGLISGARGMIYGMFTGLIEAAIKSGDLRKDVDAGDIVRTLIGVFHTTAIPGWEASARRIVGVLIDGSRRR